MSSLLFARYDGRPNYKERKLCNFVTGTINCSHMLLGHCYTESDIARIGFYDLHEIYPNQCDLEIDDHRSNRVLMQGKFLVSYL